MTLNGAGSSFVYPLVSRWQQHYDAARIEYNPIGSGGGIESISNRTVDFAGSDAPLTPDQRSSCKGCVQIPWAVSATSIAYRLSGAPEHLRITGPVLADIFLGRIKKWDDSRLQSLNQGVHLPPTTITPIFRSDSSGTTYNFTEYLSKVSPDWADKVGNGTQVNFPVGTGGAKSSGVSAALTRTDGGITYVDVAYALENDFSYFAVRNSRDRFVLPTLPAIRSAAAGVDRVPRDGAVSIVDPPGASAYPICTFTYVILRKNSAKAAHLRDFVEWALTTGQQYGPKLLFAPVPKEVVSAGRRTIG